MVTTRALGRRSHSERKVLALLRGEVTASRPTRAIRPNRASAAGPPTPPQARRMTELRHMARERGLAIMPPRTPYVGSDELLILSWLAGAQRVTGPPSPPQGDQAFLMAIVGCAALLDSMGLHLSPLTLYSARLQSGIHAPTRRMGGA